MNKNSKSSKVLISHQVYQINKSTKELINPALKVNKSTKLLLPQIQNKESIFKPKSSSTAIQPPQPTKVEIYFVGEKTYFPGITDIYVHFPTNFNKDIYISANYNDDSGEKEHWMIYWFEKFNLKFGVWRCSKVPDNYNDCLKYLKEVADPKSLDYGNGFEFIRYGVKFSDKYNDVSIESITDSNPNNPNPMGEYAIKFFYN